MQCRLLAHCPRHIFGQRGQLGGEEEAQRVAQREREVGLRSRRAEAAEAPRQPPPDLVLLALRLHTQYYYILHLENQQLVSN
jgi:hypothetical protein